MKIIYTTAIYTTAAALTLSLGAAARAGISQGNSAAEPQSGLNTAIAAHVDGISGVSAESKSYLHPIDITRTAARPAPDTFAPGKWDAISRALSFGQGDSRPGQTTFSLKNADGSASAAQASRGPSQYNGPAPAVVSLPSSAPIGLLTLATLSAIGFVRRIIRRVV